MSLESRLLKLKETVDEKKAEIQRLEGQLAEVQRTLKEQFKVNTLADAEKLLAKMEADERRLAEELEREVTELEEKLVEVG